MNKRFHRFAALAAQATGHWAAFALAVLVVVAWAITGIFVGYSNTLFQLAINTGTTIITFLMVFLIQGSQNTDTAALHAKIDNLLVSLEGPDSNLAGIEREDEP